MPDDRRPAGLRRRLAAMILVLMASAGAVLLWRRLAGALAEPLPAEALAGLALLLAGAAVAARWLWSADAGRASVGRLARLVPWCPSALLLAIGAAVCLRGTSATGIVVFWLAIVLEEGAAGLWMVRRRRELHGRGADAMGPLRIEPVELSVPDGHAAQAPAVAALPADGPAEIEHAATMGATGDETPGGQVTQQFVRSRSAEGGDVFSGWLRVEMPAHGRTTSVHVAFCPPFARAPAIEVHQVDGPPGRIKTVQALPYGARLDVKLSQPSEEATTVLLRFVASLNEDS